MGKNLEELQRENQMLRQEIKVAREAANITAEFVVKQFEQTEQMLRRFQEADAERQAVLDAATQLSIIATDLDGTIQLFSRGASTLLGYKARDMVDNVNILSLHLPDELEHYGQEVSGGFESSISGMEIFGQYVKQQQTRGREWLYICQDGKLLEVNLSITGLFGAAGRMIGYLFTAMDLSAHKQLEYELRQARDIAESANASKGDFLARMSHEIRTPMNGIIGMTHLLQKTELDSLQESYADKLLISANTLLRLINDILDFSKIDAGKLELEAIPFNIEDVFRNITNVIGVQAEQKGLEFLFHSEPYVPYNLIGDPLRLGQILMNLAGNAVKFTAQGEIVISVTVKERSAENILLQFIVRDTGIGLQPEQVDHLFTAFSQADDSITRKYGGTGLGLAICKELSEMMGGKIWVESELGKGSEFIFTCRFALTGVEQNRIHENEDHFHGLRALVVDDNEAARNILVSLLTSFNMKVDSVNGGKEAIERLEKGVSNQEPYDVVLLDWVMPGIDGIETARRIRSNDILAKVPAMLMVTANGREEAYVEAEKVGLDAFLLKPVYGSVLYNTILQILGKETVSAGPSSNKNAVEVDLSTIQGSRILLVDDNTINLEVGTAFLRDVGMIVNTARNGHECLDALEQHGFDLILMDIQMPVMDGLETSRRIRQNDKYRNLPIVAMTAHAMSADREKSLAAGMDEHINKPIEPFVLYQTLKKLIPAGKKTDAHSVKKPCFKEPESDVLPSLPVLDTEKGLRRLNYNSQLFLSMLQEFKSSFAMLPTELQELSVAGDWKNIQEKVHTLKGVAGYIGADALLKKARSLEKALLNDQKEVAAQSLPTFINTLDQVLSALTTLPDKQQNTATKISATKVHDPSKNDDLENIAEQILLFIRQLQMGELAAEERFLHIKKMAAGGDYDEILFEIERLIDDFEFEEAAERASTLLQKIQPEFSTDVYADSH